MKLHLGRYDYASYGAFCAYACSSLVIPIVLVDLARSLNFPLEDGGMSDGGLMQICRGGAMVVALIACGGIGARFGKRLTMGLAMLMMGSGILAAAFVNSFGWLLPFLAIAGIGEGICEGMATPFVHDLHKSDQAGYVSIAHSFWSVGICFSVVLAGALVALGFSWRGIVAASGIFSMLVSLGFHWRERRGLEYPEKRFQDSGGDVWRQTSLIVRCPRFWVYCLGMFVGAGAEFCLTFWSASFIRLHYGTSAWIGGLGTACLALGMFLGRSGYGKFVPENRQPHLLVIAAACGVPITIAMQFIDNAFIGSSGLSLIMQFFLMFLSGFSIAPYWPTLQVYGAKQLPELDSTMLFIWFSSVGIPGCAFFTWLMGFLGDHIGLEKSLYIVPASMAFYALLILLEAFVFPRRKCAKAV